MPAARVLTEGRTGIGCEVREHGYFGECNAAGADVVRPNIDTGVIAGTAGGAHTCESGSEAPTVRGLDAVLKGGGGWGAAETHCVAG